MPFSEEVPADFKPSYLCKRRSCAMQDIFEDKAHGKRFFKYQCKDVAKWCVCLRWLPLSDKSEEAKAEPKSQISQKSQDAPATEQPPAPFSCPFEGCHFVAKNEFALNKHLDSIHHAAVATPVYEAEPVCEGIGEKP